jgi:hypothetical protein
MGGNNIPIVKEHHPDSKKKQCKNVFILKKARNMGKDLLHGYGTDG